MKFRILLSILSITLFQHNVDAQVLNNKILMNIAGKDIEAGEFIRMYKKSMTPGTSMDLESYIDQFVTYKLKVADAVNKRYDTTKAFKKELNGYRNQLAQNYLSDPETREKLLRRMYERSLTEINAWHILVSCAPDASPEDTLYAWDKAIDIRERIISGEPFEQVARSSSDDKSVNINRGNLGYFSVFQMIMPFEDAAYRLKKGEISMPVRTSFGYHIIKVADKRPSKGKIKVAHIMKAAPPGISDTTAKRAEKEIFEIYNQLINGQSFSDLAARCSDHKESASAGGEMNWFGTGEIISDFSEAAFSIANPGEFTKPVRTVYGWHIIKLLDKKATGSFDETRSFLEARINQSYLNSISKKALVNKLKKEYRFRINKAALNWFIENTDTLILTGISRYDRNSMPSGTFYSFANQSISTREFASFIEKRRPGNITEDPEKFILKSIETRASNHIIDYENSMLEKKYPDFRYLINEFHDGILLFEISEEKIWNVLQNDSSGLEKYYEKHKNNYLTPRGIEAKIYTLKDPEGKNLLKKAYNKYSGKNNADQKLLKRFNKHGDTLIHITEGKWFEGGDLGQEIVNRHPGVHQAVMDGYPSLVVIKNIIAPEPLPLKDVKEELMTVYQSYLESEWIKQLKTKYNVKIDNLVYDEIRKNLTNE
jgi:peptidyl-prolyl cis-trans isomerase SurA